MGRGHIMLECVRESLEAFRHIFTRSLPNIGLVELHMALFLIIIANY